LPLRLSVLKLSLSALSCKSYSGMDELELVLFGTFLVILVQTLIELRPSSAVEDHMLTYGTFEGCIDLDSNDVQFAMATAALYNYWVNCGLLCFEVDLRFWIKP
jgi:hypothetical protein